MRYCLVFLLIWGRLFLQAQKHEANILAGYGLCHAFNDRTLSHKLDHVQFIGFNYVFSKKKSVFAFNPGLLLQGYDYRARLSNDGLAHVNQNMFSLTMDMLLRLNKATYLRVGLFMSEVFSNVLFLTSVDSQGRKTSNYGGPGLYTGYSPANPQAGITLGLCFPFILFHHGQKFDIRLTQLATSVVEQDYYPDKRLTGGLVKVQSVKARPTSLSLGFEFNLATKGPKELEPLKEEE